MRPGLTFEVPRSLPRETTWLSKGERARLASMRFPRRRHDFRLGRWTAKRALARRFGLSESLPSLGEIEIRAGERGAPRAFLGGEAMDCDVSLSHRQGAVLFAIGPRGSRVGCDVEWIEERSQAFVATFLSAAERRWLSGLSPAARSGGANLLWSAKESALKALGTGLDVDLRQVEVRLSEDAGQGVRVVIPCRGESLSGCWGQQGDWLWTLASPVPLEVPTMPMSAR